MMRQAARHHLDIVARQADFAQAQQFFAAELAFTGRCILQGIARDQLQHCAIGPAEVHRVRLPGAVQGEVLATVWIAQQGGACPNPLRSGLETRWGHVEGQMHAAHRVLRLHALQCAPADAHRVAVCGQLQHIAVEAQGQVGVQAGQYQMTQMHGGNVVGKPALNDLKRS